MSANTRKRKIFKIQRAQNRNGGSVNGDALTGRELRDMQRWTLYCKEKLGSYERLAQIVPDRKYGWLQHVGSGNFKQIRPTRWDYKFIRMAHTVLSREDTYLDLSL